MKRLLLLICLTGCQTFDEKSLTPSFSSEKDNFYISYIDRLRATCVAQYLSEGTPLNAKYKKLKKHIRYIGAVDKEIAQMALDGIVEHCVLGIIEKKFKEDHSQ